MKQEKLLRQAIEAARDRGIKIGRRATFDWATPGPDGQPASCDATGAVLLHMGRPNMGPGWLKTFCEHLDVDAFWCWRFWMGWDSDYQVQVWVGDDKGRWVDDEVSHFSRRLARELVSK